MKLFYRKYGQGQPLFILHGLFGQCDNWNSLAKLFAESGFEVFTIDLRNHGLSPWSDDWNYKVMSEDVVELAHSLNLDKITLLGHSMGGKVAMEIGAKYPDLLQKLVVVDIGPKYYAPHHQVVLKALNAVDFNVVKTRKEVEAILSEYLSDYGTKQFLLKNIYWDENEKLAWRFNLKIINDNIEVVGTELSDDSVCELPTLFIRGGLSNYIKDEDIDGIQQIFSSCILKTIDGAGHWVHAEKPVEFSQSVLDFIK